ncbi:MAG: hypothetical protein WBB28_02015 [Crinalium sp.]
MNQEQLYANLSRVLDRYNYQNPPANFDEYFKNAPSNDFFWESECGDWHVFPCGDKDCPVGWHKAAYRIDMGREEGVRIVRVGSCDEDGNHDTQFEWREDEPYEFAANELAVYENTDSFLSDGQDTSPTALVARKIRLVK